MGTRARLARLVRGSKRSRGLSAKVLTPLRETWRSPQDKVHTAESTGVHLPLRMSGSKARWYRACQHSRLGASSTPGQQPRAENRNRPLSGHV